MHREKGLRAMNCIASAWVYFEHRVEILEYIRIMDVTSEDRKTVSKLRAFLELESSKV